MICGFPRSIFFVGGFTLCLLLLFLSVGHSHDHPSDTSPSSLLPSSDSSDSTFSPHPVAHFFMQPCISTWGRFSNKDSSPLLKPKVAGLKETLQFLVEDVDKYLQGRSDSLQAALNRFQQVSPTVCIELAAAQRPSLRQSKKCQCEDIFFLHALLLLNTNDIQKAGHVLKSNTLSPLGHGLLSYIFLREGHISLAKAEFEKMGEHPQAWVFQNALSHASALTEDFFPVFEHSILISFFGFSSHIYEEDLGYAILQQALPISLRQKLSPIYTSFSGQSVHLIAATKKSLGLAFQSLIGSAVHSSLSPDLDSGEYHLIAILGDPSLDPPQPLCYEHGCISFDTGDILIVHSDLANTLQLQETNPTTLLYKKN